MEVLKDRVAVISGAVGEIGQAIGLRFARKGAKVVVSDTDKIKIDELVARIQAEGGQAIGIATNAARSGDVKALVAKVIDQNSRIDILINNMDCPGGKPIAELSDEDWDDCIAVNLNSVFYFCREVLPKMREQKYGRIINVGSLDYIGWPGKANYSAAKSAIFGLTRSLALESAKDDVTVNCVAKGDLRSADMSDEQAEKLAAAIPVKKLGTPEDVARAVGYFASDASGYVTGQTFFVCGGKSAHFSMSI
ncbi:MAG: SDR family oxidoreductase [Deltaproteobacteria bacterium]|nr:SDR family oxidoreductase [Deltaproteobacteria bacterium]